MYNALLEKSAKDGHPIRVGIVGSGKFGSGLVAQLSQMEGVEASAIADTNLNHARHAYTATDIAEESIRVGKNTVEIDDAIQSGKPVITEDGLGITKSNLIDVVVEATGIPDAGARVGFHAVTHGKHLVMVNVETDVTIGPLLKHLADSANVVYTLVDGDQPGVTMNMVDWAKTLGFEIVAAGRGTEFLDEDRAATPDTVAERFGFSEEMIQRRTINLRMFNSFRDGSKAQIEMTALANMTGLLPDVRGMHEPSLNIADIPNAFSLKDRGGILSQHGVVELANSIAGAGKTMLDRPLNMGVFVVIRTEHPYIQEDLAGYHLHASADGQNFLLYRPYHLEAVEAPISIVKAALYGQPTGAPLTSPVADVIALTKRDLKQGETLDGSGGYTLNGLIERAEIARAKNLVPLGLTYGARLKADVEKGTAITYDMVELEANSFVVELRRIQDSTLWHSPCQIT